MSDNWLQLIPSDPEFQPSPQAASQACSLLSTFVPEADDVSVSFKSTTEFFHPGANWSGVQCSSCGADAETWWHEAMAAAYQTNFKELIVTAPCCGARG